MTRDEIVAQLAALAPEIARGAEVGGALTVTFEPSEGRVGGVHTARYTLTACYLLEPDERTDYYPVFARRVERYFAEPVQEAARAAWEAWAVPIGL